MQASLLNFIIEVEQEKKQDDKKRLPASTLSYILLHCEYHHFDTSSFRVLHLIAKFRFNIAN